jgi:putative tryptophan/tyrosine transport system substrate-binding protein
MKRREFITLVGGAAVSGPLAAHAQQPERMRRVCVLMLLAENDPSSQKYVSTFTRGLREARWLEGVNVQIVYRWNARELEQAKAEAKELVGSQADVVVAHGSTSLIALKQATNAIPIVFTLVSEPVGNGFVASLARPGGNITGFSNLEATVGSKWVETIKEIAPRVERLAIIFNPEVTPTAVAFAHFAETAARNLAIEPVVAPVHGAADIETNIVSMGRKGGGALIVAPDAFMFGYRKLIIRLAEQYRLPTIYQFRSFAADGGLLSYGVDPIHQFRQAAGYVDRILRGAKPADLPVQQPTKFELVINLKTAKALGIDVPPMLIARADEVIE